MPPLPVADAVTGFVPLDLSQFGMGGMGGGMNGGFAGGGVRRGITRLRGTVLDRFLRVGLGNESITQHFSNRNSLNLRNLGNSLSTVR